MKFAKSAILNSNRIKLISTVLKKKNIFLSKFNFFIQFFLYPSLTSTHSYQNIKKKFISCLREKKYTNSVYAEIFFLLLLAQFESLITSSYFTLEGQCHAWKWKGTKIFFFLIKFRLETHRTRKKKAHAKKNFPHKLSMNVVDFFFQKLFFFLANSSIISWCVYFFSFS